MYALEEFWASQPSLTRYLGKETRSFIFLPLNHWIAKNVVKERKIFNIQLYITILEPHYDSVAPSPDYEITVQSYDAEKNVNVGMEPIELG